jgi:pimeloyl-ACP methyl ester carboxylesterase
MRASLAYLVLLGVFAPAARADKPLEFCVTFDKSVSATPFTGRVFVLLAKRPMSEPPTEPDWFDPEPMLARDVRDWKPEEPLVIDGNALAFPVALAKLPKDTYSIMAVMDFDRGEWSFAAGEGNGYSKAVRLRLDPANQGPVPLKIDKVFHESRFIESDRTKLVDVESKSLSAFHGRPVRMRAAISLPKSFTKEVNKRYPVIYEIPGFGGDHRASAVFDAGVTGRAGVEFIHVMLDPRGRLGHHVFADSENNGPWARALVEELIPHIEKTYRGIARSTARFVTGHSSGGWSSLWLQVTHPDCFGGVWSTAPDEVDFRDYQRTDIYQPGANLFVDAAGKLRPMARQGGKATVFNQPFSDMEIVMGHGGQMGSCESVFSPRGNDGKPQLLWDRRTGAVDPVVAKAWERYDIRLLVERNWPALGPKLAGKLHIYVGSEDTFYLEVAVGMLKESLRNLGSNAVIEIFPGRDHSTLLDSSLRNRIAAEMARQFRKHHSP